jgi:hypothetical protein
MQTMLVNTCIKIEIPNILGENKSLKRFTIGLPKRILIQDTRKQLSDKNVVFFHLKARFHIQLYILVKSALRMILIKVTERNSVLSALWDDVRE